MSKIALVTGGTRGIGEAISKRLRKDGYKVIVNYGSNDEAAKKFSDENDIETFKCDVSNYGSTSEFWDFLIQGLTALLATNTRTKKPTTTRSRMPT